MSLQLTSKPPLQKTINIFCFFRSLTLSIAFLRQGTKSDVIDLSFYFMQFMSYFLSVLSLFDFSMRLQTTRMFRQYSRIESRSQPWIILLKINSDIFLIFHLNSLGCEFAKWGFPKSTMKMYYLSYWGLYISKYLKLFKMFGSIPEIERIWFIFVWQNKWH